MGKCPLCGTPVLNPRQPAPDLSENPNPDVFEEAISHMDRGYARQLAVVAVLIALMLSFIATADLSAQVTLSAGTLEVTLSRAGAVTALRNTMSRIDYLPPDHPAPP